MALLNFPDFQDVVSTKHSALSTLPTSKRIGFATTLRPKVVAKALVLSAQAARTRGARLAWLYVCGFHSGVRVWAGSGRGRGFDIAGVGLQTITPELLRA